MATKKFVCPYCRKTYLEKPYLYEHMHSTHKDQLGNLTPAHAYFNFKYKKTTGKCIVCGRETTFNEETERYDRICSTRCSELYRKEFKRRMNSKYGKDHLLNDPDQQKKMLASRKISGEYTWSDGAKKTYTGSYELDALSYLDKTLGLASKDVLAPSPITIPYTHEGKKHFYIPDIYIIPYKLLVEVKGSNNHYQTRDHKQEVAKDKAALKSEYNYVKVLDKNYKNLVAIVDKIKNL